MVALAAGHAATSDPPAIAHNQLQTKDATGTTGIQGTQWCTRRVRNIVVMGYAAANAMGIGTGEFATVQGHQRTHRTPIVAYHFLMPRMGRKTHHDGGNTGGRRKAAENQGRARKWGERNAGLSAPASRTPPVPCHMVKVVGATTSRVPHKHTHAPGV